MRHLTRLRRLLPRRPGQSYILFAFMLPVLIGFVGLGIDYSYMFYRSVDVQGAADLAALAGASDLPGSSANAISAARAITAANGFTTGLRNVVVTVNTPYGGNASKIEVVITNPQPTFFIRLLGFNTVNLRGRAVATAAQQAGYAMFANYKTSNTSCGSEQRSTRSITISSSSNYVTGNVHTNSALYMPGSSNTIDGNLTFRCSSEFIAGGNTFKSSSTSAARAIPDPPASYTASSFTCNWANSGAVSGKKVTDSSFPDGDFTIAGDGPWWVNNSKSSGRLRPGVYCSKGFVKIGETASATGVTFVALGQVQMAASNLNLSPPANNVLFASFYDGTWNNPAIQLSGGQSTFKGIFFAPTGQVMFSGSNNIVTNTMIVADTIFLSGGNNQISAAAGSGGAIRLSE